jgi:ribosome-binding factor A
MPTRRQEKTARVIREVVSDAIANHLNDPRITGFVSVTRVEVMADMRSADVYLSIFASKEAGKDKTFAAITHARTRIQSFLAEALESKFCPVLRFHVDEQFRKTLDVMRLIDEVSGERRRNEEAQAGQELPEPPQEEQ